VETDLVHPLRIVAVTVGAFAAAGAAVVAASAEPERAVLGPERVVDACRAAVARQASVTGWPGEEDVQPGGGHVTVAGTADTTLGRTRWMCIVTSGGGVTATIG
jgi:hypothetical protein